MDTRRLEPAILSIASWDIWQSMGADTQRSSRDSAREARVFGEACSLRSAQKSNQQPTKGIEDEKRSQFEPRSLRDHSFATRIL
jgi:hypothetical protein